jgi:hypothetical protein
LFEIVFNPGGILISRLYGAALLIFGLQLYLSRNAEPSKDLQASILATSLGNMVAVVVTLMAQIAGVINYLGWFLVVVYILTASLFIYFFFETAQRVQQR